MLTTDHLQLKLQQEITDLTTTVCRLIENFHKLRTPLAESHEKVPQATTQLDKIAQQTEAATHRMLDTVEAITQRDERIIAGLAELEADHADRPATIARLRDLAAANQNDTFAIMDALQFQDITSQQMNHAAAMLEDIPDRLNAILSMVTGTSVGRASETEDPVRRERAYDPHADMFDRKTEQADIDTIFSQKGRKDK